MDLRDTLLDVGGVCFWRQGEQDNNNDNEPFYLDLKTYKERPYSLEVLRSWVLQIEENNKVIDLDFDKIKNNLNALIKKHDKQFVITMFTRGS